VNTIPADLTAYLASEKLDGVRCIWTGYEFMTRHGKRLNPPAWFAAGMPEGVRLDGELYMGRDTFARLQSAMQKRGGDWDGIQFHVFDLAEMRLTTQERVAKLQTITIPAHCRLVPHMEIEDLDAMEAEIVNGGGEGLCLRAKSEFYSPLNFIKVKRLFPDLERWQG
jgi:DNA ligase-1